MTDPNLPMLSAHDQRCMLRMLLVEAARYQHHRKLRKSSSSCRSTISQHEDGGSTRGPSCEDLGLEEQELPHYSTLLQLNANDTAMAPPLGGWTVVGGRSPSPIRSDENNNSPNHHNSSNHNHKASSPYATDEFVRLMDQLDQTWDTSYAQTSSEKYTRLKCKLTSLFLWDSDRTDERDFEDSPYDALASIAEKHRQRLALLPKGKLFF
jgi:hypothetical protein